MPHQREFPISPIIQLRHQWRACRTKASALRLALRLILNADRTQTGKRCEYCQLEPKPTPNCYVPGQR